MLVQAPAVPDLKLRCYLEWEFEDKWVWPTFHGRGRCVLGHATNLHSRSPPPPPTGHAKTAEADVTPDFNRSHKKVGVNFGADLCPLCLIEALSGLDRGDAVPIKPEHHTTALIRTRKEKAVFVSRLPAVLTGTTNSSIKQKAQVIRIEATPFGFEQVSSPTALAHRRRFHSCDSASIEYENLGQAQWLLVYHLR